MIDEVKRSWAQSEALKRGVSGLTDERLQVFGDRLSLAREYDSNVRDRFGNFDISCLSVAERSGVLIAQADEGIGVRPNPGRWPGGAPFAVCLTHDVDVVSSVHTVRRAMRRVHLALRARGGTWSAWMRVVASLARLATPTGHREALRDFNEWLGLAERFGASATWFFLSPPARKVHAVDMDWKFDDRMLFKGVRSRVRDVIRELAARGHEVALHGSFFALETVDSVAEQRGRLEAVAQSAVTSIRQHYLRFDAQRGPIVLEQAGFSADSSVGFNEGVGFRAGTAFPFPLWNWPEGRATSVTEVPLSLMDSALMGAFSTIDQRLARELALGLVAQVEALGGVLVVNAHPNYANLPEVFDLVEEVLMLCQAKAACFLSIREVARRWSELGRTRTT